MRILNKKEMGKGKSPDKALVKNGSKKLSQAERLKEQFIKNRLSGDGKFMSIELPELSESIIETPVVKPKRIIDDSDMF